MYLAVHYADLDVATGLARLREARASLSDPHDTIRVARCDLLEALLRLHSGDLEGCIACAERPSSPLDVAGDGYAKLAALALGLARAGLGELERARCDVDRAIAIAEREGARRAHALYRAYLGGLELAAGDPHLGVRRLSSAILDLEAAGDLVHALFFEAIVSLGRAVLGERIAMPRGPRRCAAKSTRTSCPRARGRVGTRALGGTTGERRRRCLPERAARPLDLR